MPSRCFSPKAIKNLGFSLKKLFFFLEIGNMTPLNCSKKSREEVILFYLYWYYVIVKNLESISFGKAVPTIFVTKNKHEYVNLGTRRSDFWNLSAFKLVSITWPFDQKSCCSLMTKFPSPRKKCRFVFGGEGGVKLSNIIWIQN